MSDYIRANVKTIKISIFLSFVVCVIYAILRSEGIIIYECTVQYLNPWQYFFGCGLFYTFYYVIIFVLTFIVLYYIIKKLKITLNG